MKQGAHSSKNHSKYQEMELGTPLERRDDDGDGDYISGIGINDPGFLWFAKDFRLMRQADDPSWDWTHVHARYRCIKYWESLLPIERRAYNIRCDPDFTLPSLADYAANLNFWKIVQAIGRNRSESCLARTNSGGVQVLLATSSNMLQEMLANYPEEIADMEKWDKESDNQMVTEFRSQIVGISQQPPTEASQEQEFDRLRNQFSSFTWFCKDYEVIGQQFKSDWKCDATPAAKLQTIMAWRNLSVLERYAYHVRSSVTYQDPTKEQKLADPDLWKRIAAVGGLGLCVGLNRDAVVETSKLVDLVNENIEIMEQDDVLNQTAPQPPPPPTMATSHEGMHQVSSQQTQRLTQYSDIYDSD